MREQDQAAASELAREERSTGETLTKLVDLARITRNKPDGTRSMVSKSLLTRSKGGRFGWQWDSATTAPFSEFTGRPWVRMDSRQEIHAEPLVDDDGDDGPDQLNPEAS